MHHNVVLEPPPLLVRAVPQVAQHAQQMGTIVLEVPQNYRVLQDTCAPRDPLIHTEELLRVALDLAANCAPLDIHVLPLRKRHVLLEHTRPQVKSTVHHAPLEHMVAQPAFQRQHVLDSALLDFYVPTDL